MKRESTLRSRLRNQESCSVHLSACRSRSCCCGSWRFGTPPLIKLSLCYPALPSPTHLQDHVGKQLCPSLSLAEREVMAWHLKPQAAGYVVVIICNYGILWCVSWHVWICLSFLAPQPVDLGRSRSIAFGCQTLAPEVAWGCGPPQHHWHIPRNATEVCSFANDRWLRCTHYHGQGLIWSSEFNDVQCL